MNKRTSATAYTVNGVVSTLEGVVVVGESLESIKRRWTKHTLATQTI
jgi:hypothetical protein